MFLARRNAAIIRDRRIRGVPDMIAEVLSPGNAEQDTKIKRAAYAQAGVPEYWIVRADTREVLCCSQPDAILGDYAQTALLESSTELVAATVPIRLIVADLFADAPDTTL
jgi:Uma2 family endonuclease